MPDSQTPDVSRREFLATCASAIQVAAVGCALAPLLSGCAQSQLVTRQRDDGRVEASVALLVGDGMASVLDRKGPDGKGIVVVRQSETSYIAMSMRCTHKGCEVAPPEDGVMICPCHGGTFDLTGAVVKKPPTEPLKRYETSYDAAGRVVLITLT